MVDTVHGGDVCEECLGRADVGRGLVSPDVLLTGLESQPVAVVLVHIPANGGKTLHKWRVTQESRVQNYLTIIITVLWVLVTKKAYKLKDNYYIAVSRENLS